jgi:hypothetical protein
MTASAEPSHHYSVFGLRVRSALVLPELIPAAGTDLPDVTISRGPVPEASDAESGLSVVDGALVLVIAGIAKYRIESGERITVEPEPGVPDRNVRLYLLGSAFGALLHQRGLLPLHANAIEIDGRAVVFMGASGEGKSTLAAWFHDRGHHVVADDVCVVTIMPDGRAFAAPGQQRLRLWKEALEASGRDSTTYARSFVGREDIDKFDVPFESQRRGAEDCELAAIYVLGTADRFMIERLGGLQATEAIFDHTYRGLYVNEAGFQQQHWQSAVAMVQCIPIFRIDRPRDLSLMDEHGRRILDHVASVIAGSV